jgi:hypothetical protein
MRRFLFLAVGLLFAATTFVLAQGHNNTTEKTVRATILLTSDVKFGNTVLRAGEYKVTCDLETIVFSESTNRDRDAQTFKFPCKGKELAAPSSHTEVDTTVDSTGAQVIQRVLLKGSNVEHVFE